MTKFERFGAVALLLAVGLMLNATAWSESRLGPQGPEGAPNRRQDWLGPTQDQITPSRAILFRPPGKGPFRLAVIAHASTQNRLARAQMPQPEYAALAAALVARGFAVLIPQRLGHGKTGGPYLEDQEGCDNAEYAMSARTTAEAITTALTFMRTQTFVRKDASVIVGHSAGGWGALALADQGRANIASIIVFAPGRGGRANDRPGNICAPDKLIAAAAEFGEGAIAVVREQRVGGGEAHAVGLQRLALVVAPERVSARGDDDRHGNARDIGAVFLPEFLRAVAPEFLVDFVENVRHFDRPPNLRKRGLRGTGKLPLRAVPRHPQ